ncbi:ADP-ribosylglycohydrolase family protein [Crocosphaera chwakensis]|uniref:ADP-ribosylglycohydrolase n=1 Tax=Crocosphaera chwakensis CCY0110 TaxID=391612 RepID=A3IUS3_9CHRO|nr:ADP-ribosylglycohydrolase family protein [Crocosphaera chwakensis]EAZ89766.1 hypothetical protein CY0110_29144 [Crocosphaera chwakensis CCY0110]
MNQSLSNSFRGSLLGLKVANLINSEKQTLLNWEIINQKVIIDLIKSETISRETCEKITFICKKSSISSGEFILVILPLILFFHETEALLHEQLEKIKKYNNITQETIEDIMIFRKITNLILNQEKPPLNHLLTVSPLLKKVETFLDNQTTLTELKKQFRPQTALDSNYLLLSLYCFCRTTDNFKLSILQASQFNYPVILGITAVLSGAYNGYSGIPVSWRLNISLKDQENSLYQQISQLWAKWAGVDEPLKIIGSIETQVITSPKFGVNKP